ncbi:hypothetical protein, partial [Streptomyces niveus]|uniref:hypothetical protein n=1 Tax=Streptomyces niveus TaxID=193462 RepID=UPI00386C6EC8
QRLALLGAPARSAGGPLRCAPGTSGAGRCAPGWPRIARPYRWGVMVRLVGPSVRELGERGALPAGPLRSPA